MLGAGLSGLTAAYKLSKAGFNVTVAEKNDFVGGLSATFAHGKSRLDFGPHNFHTHLPGVLEFVRDELGVPLRKLELRSSKLFFMGKLIDYPIRIFDALGKLSLMVAMKCFAGYALTRLRRRFSLDKADDSFEGWVKSRFGEYFYDLYFGPYVQKVWGIPGSQIDTDVARRRIPDPSLAALVARALFGFRFYAKHSEDLTTTDSYYPPLGIGAISDALAERITGSGSQILLGTVPEKIELSPRAHRARLKTPSGMLDVECDYIVNTIPLDDFIEVLIAPEKEKIASARDNLKYRSLILLYMFLKVEKIFDYPWVYFNERGNPDLIFNRVSEIGGFSADMISEKKGVLCLEITCYKGDELWNKTDAELYETCVAYLEKNNFLKRDVVGEILTRRLDKAYPVFRKGYKITRDEVLDFLDGFGNSVACIGRQGRFTYSNMDRCVDMGSQAALIIVSGGDLRKISSGDPER